MSVFLGDSPFAAFEEANCHMVKAGLRGCGQPPANIQQETRADSLTACKKLDAANMPWSLQADPSLDKLR